MKGHGPDRHEGERTVRREREAQMRQRAAGVGPVADWRGDKPGGNAQEERRSRGKQWALKEKRCETETNKSVTVSYSCGSHTLPDSCCPF